MALACQTKERQLPQDALSKYRILHYLLKHFNRLPGFRQIIALIQLEAKLENERADVPTAAREGRQNGARDFARDDVNL